MREQFLKKVLEFESSEYFHILTLFEQNDKFHQISYVRYSYKSEDRDSILYREYIIKVDRLYFLEIANILISNSDRVNLFLTILGKRRFGVSKNNLNKYLLDYSYDIKSVIQKILNIQKSERVEDVSYERMDQNLNLYKMYYIKNLDKFYVYLNQQNKSNIKVIQKRFLVELKESQYYELINLYLNSQKVDYLFQCIGKIYFDSLAKKSIKIESSESVLEAIESLKQDEREKPKIDFDEIRRAFPTLKRAYIELSSISTKFLKNLDKDEYIKFIYATRNYLHILSKVKNIDSINLNLNELLGKVFENSKLLELLIRDNNFKDIFIHFIENLEIWQNEMVDKSISKEDKIASAIDFIEYLKYLKSSFEYSLKVYTKERERELKSFSNEELNQNRISAKELFEEIEVEIDLMEELNDLESEIREIIYIHDEIDSTIIENFLIFFNKYARMLNSIYEVRNIGYSINLLVEFLNIDEIEKLSDKKRDFLYTLLKCIVADLIKWRDSVMIRKSAEDIHYMDKSFEVNCLDIKNILTPESNNRFENSDSLELFDDSEVEFF